MEKRVSDRMDVGLTSNFSQNSSPERSAGPPKSVGNIRNDTKSDKRLTSDDGGRSTAVSTQRPPDRMRNNAVLSPAATSQGTRSQNTGGKQGGNRPMSGSSNDGRSVAAPSAEDPISAQASKALHQKKNATITEEEEYSYDDEDGDSVK